MSCAGCDAAIICAMPEPGAARRGPHATLACLPCGRPGHARVLAHQARLERVGHALAQPRGPLPHGPRCLAERGTTAAETVVGTPGAACREGGPVTRSAAPPGVRAPPHVCRLAWDLSDPGDRRGAARGRSGVHHAAPPAARERAGAHSFQPGEAGGAHCPRQLPLLPGALPLDVGPSLRRHLPRTRAPGRCPASPPPPGWQIRRSRTTCSTCPASAC